MEKKRWRAAEGEEYWLVDSECNVMWMCDWYRPGDDARYEVGNYFKTQEEALEAAVEIRKIFKKWQR